MDVIPREAEYSGRFGLEMNQADGPENLTNLTWKVYSTMYENNRSLVTDEPVEFETG